MGKQEKATSFWSHVAKEVGRELNLASLKVETMTRTSREVVETLKRRRLHIALIQETRWKGSKSTNTGEGYKIMYCGSVASRNNCSRCITGQGSEHPKEERLADKSDNSTEQRTNTPFLRQICTAGSCMTEEKAKFQIALDQETSEVPQLKLSS